jgi:hypothetical protein
MKTVTVSVRSFQGADKARKQQLIPAQPGLYLWGHDLNPFVGADGLHIQRRLKEALGLVGRERTRSVPPYQRITIQDERVPISDAKRLVLQSAFSSGDAFGNWLAEVTTQFQRPLYAGMTLDLHNRIRQHLAQGSRLRTRLESEGADLLDLAVTWIAAPLPAAEEEEEGQVDMESLDRQLKAAESLLIRLTMPMFNERQD